MLGRFLTGAVITAWLLAACGGAKETGLFGGDTGGGGDTDSGSTVDASSHVDSGSGGHDSSTGNDSGNTEKDSGNPPPKDSGPPPPQHVVHCDNADCPVPAQVCCRTGIAPTFTYACTAPSGCVSSGTDVVLPIPCDDTKDCASGVCCVTASNTGGASDVTCRPASECTSANGRTLVCDPQVDTCPNGQQCRPSQSTLPGYDICR